MAIPLGDVQNPYPSGVEAFLSAKKCCAAQHRVWHILAPSLRPQDIGASLVRCKVHMVAILPNTVGLAVFNTLRCMVGTYACCVIHAVALAQKRGEGEPPNLRFAVVLGSAAKIHVLRTGGICKSPFGRLVWLRMARRSRCHPKPSLAYQGLSATSCPNGDVVAHSMAGARAARCAILDPKTPLPPPSPPAPARTVPSENSSQTEPATVEPQSARKSGKICSSAGMQNLCRRGFENRQL